MEETETLKAELAKKDALIDEMKTAADAQHADFERLAAAAERAALDGKAAAELAETRAAEIAQIKETFAAELAAKNADLTELDRQYAQMKADYEARDAARETRAASLKADLETAHAAEKAKLEARIAELEAAAKTAEQIAAEKYGAAAPERVDASPAGEPGALRERARAALGNPGELAKLAKELSPEQIKSLKIKV